MFQKIQVVRSPKHRLSTFGTSRINYQLVTDVPGFADRSRLRTGLVIAEKPTLITPDALRDQFQGFGAEAAEYLEALTKQYGNVIRGLDYQFRNEPVSSRVELSPVDKFLQELAKDHDKSGGFDNAVIKGPDDAWGLSIMKFIVEETLASFSTNVQELHDRGFFEEGDRTVNRQRREIQALFAKAQTDKSLIPKLGAKLHAYKLFEEFQDEFFHLVNR